MARKKKQTLAAGSMFPTDDLPLFSSTPVQVEDSPFAPEAQPDPDAPTVNMFAPQVYTVRSWEEARGVLRARTAGTDLGFGVGNTYPARFNAVTLDARTGEGTGYSLHDNNGNERTIGPVVAYVHVRPNGKPCRVLPRSTRGTIIGWADRVEADSVAAFLDRWYKPDRLVREPGTRERLIASYEHELAQHGYCFIPAPDAITGRTVYYFDPQFEWIESDDYYGWLALVIEQIDDEQGRWWRGVEQYGDVELHILAGSGRASSPLPRQGDLDSAVSVEVWLVRDGQRVRPEDVGAREMRWGQDAIGEHIPWRLVVELRAHLRLRATTPGMAPPIRPDAGLVRYRISRMHDSSARYGPCEICGAHVAEVWLQTRERYYVRGEHRGWSEESSAFGHLACLERCR